MDRLPRLVSVQLGIWAAVFMLSATGVIADQQATPAGVVTSVEQSPQDRVAAVQATTEATARAAIMAASTGLSDSEAARFAAEGLQRAIKRVLVERAVDDPSTSSTQAAAQHQLTVVADKGDVNGRARFYIPLGPIDAQLTFTAPLSGGKATFATQEGIGNNVVVNASAKYSIWRKASQDLPTIDSSRRVAGVGASTPTGQQYLAALERIRRGAATGDFRAIATALIAGGDPRLARLAASPSLVSTPERFYAAVAQSLPDLVAARWVGYLTPGFETTKHAIDYLDAENGTSQTFEKSSNVVTFSGGVGKMAEWRKSGETETFLTPLFYAGVSLRAGNTVTVPDEKNVCRPLGANAGLSECLEAPFGVPVNSDIVSLTIEHRQWALNQSIGFNPRFTYSSQKVEGGETKKIKTFEVPIYFMHQVKDINVRDVSFGADLTGGVSAGWRDDGKKSGAFVTLFLTKVFDVP